MSNAKQELTARIRQALVDASAIGDPDQLDYYAESAVEALVGAADGDEGWLTTRGEVNRVVEVHNTDTDDGHRYWELSTEANEEPE